jgi:hypothetical protein
MNELNEIKKLVSDGQFDEAITMVDTISVDYYKVQAIKLIAATFADKNEFDQAIKIANQLSDQYNDKSDTLKEIALRMAKHGKTEEALNLSDSLQYDFQKLAVLNYIKKGLSKQNNPNKIKKIDEIIDSMDDEESSNYKYSNIDDEDYEEEEEIEEDLFDDEFDDSDFYHNENIEYK